MTQFLPQRALSAAVALIVLASLATGVARAAPEGDITSTITAQAIEITIASGSINFGSAPFGSCPYTSSVFATNGAATGMCPAGPSMVPGQTQTVTNAGSPARILARYKPLAPNVWGANCDATATTAEWIPSGTSPPGVGTFMMFLNYRETGSGVDSLILIETGFGGMIDNTLASGNTASIDYQLLLPLSSSFFGPCTIGTTILATAP